MVAETIPARLPLYQPPPPQHPHHAAAAAAAAPPTMMMMLASADDCAEEEGGYPYARGTLGGLKCCAKCGTTKTPQWREGPCGPKTLCSE